MSNPCIQSSAIDATPSSLLHHVPAAVSPCTSLVQRQMPVQSKRVSIEASSFRWDVEFRGPTRFAVPASISRPFSFRGRRRFRGRLPEEVTIHSTRHRGLSMEFPLLPCHSSHLETCAGCALGLAKRQGLQKRKNKAIHPIHPALIEEATIRSTRLHAAFLCTSMVKWGVSERASILHAQSHLHHPFPMQQPSA